MGLDNFDNLCNFLKFDISFYLAFKLDAFKFRILKCDTAHSLSLNQ